MTSTFNHINASEQIALASITTPLFANGAITPNKLGEAASVVIQDITYTAVNGGADGNSISITYIEDGTAGFETVNVSGTSITVHIGNHTILGSTATQVRAAVLLSSAASLLVLPVISGTSSNIQLAVSATPLAGGITGATGVSSLHVDSNPNIAGAIQLVSGSHITLSQVGQVITVNATGELAVDLTDSHIFVGNASNVATDVAMSGDATIIADGTLTLSNTTVTAASYTLTNLTVDSKGRLTAASSTPIGDLTDVGTDGITISGGTGVVLGSGTSISQHVADSTHNGYLSSTDWSTFDSKQNALTFGSISETTSSILTILNGSNSTVGPNVTIQVAQADGSTSGYLSSTDWNTFNSKQPSGSYITALTSDVSASGPGSASATVNSVGGSSASNIHSAELSANAATDTNTVSTIVKRDGSGNFSAGTVTVINMILTGVTSDPISPSAGQVWFRSDTSQFMGYNGTSTVLLG